MLGGCWENVSFYCAQGIRLSLSWWKIELIGHQPQVLMAWAFCGCRVLIIIGEEAWLPAAAPPPPLSLSWVSRLPEGHGANWLCVSRGLRVHHFRQLIIQGSRDGAYCSLSPLSGCPSDLSSCFILKCWQTALHPTPFPVWGKPRQIWTCPGRAH